MTPALTPELTAACATEPMTAPGPGRAGPQELGWHLGALSAWIDAANTGRDPEAQLWARTAKITEEAGEVVAALIGVTGQNPRKGTTHDLDDVRAELLDVAVTALCAWEHLDHNHGRSATALAAHVTAVTTRAGLIPPLPPPDGPSWACPVCDLSTGRLPTTAEARLLAGIHDELHHHGRPTAALTTHGGAR